MLVKYSFISTVHLYDNFDRQIKLDDQHTYTQGVYSGGILRFTSMSEKFNVSVTAADQVVSWTKVNHLLLI